MADNQEQLYGFIKKDVDRLQRMLRAFELRFNHQLTLGANRRGDDVRHNACGKLKTELERGGKAVMTIHLANPEGGMGDATDKEIDIVDVDMLSSTESPLPAGTNVKVYWAGNAWVLDTKDCDEVET